MEIFRNLSGKKLDIDNPETIVGSPKWYAKYEEMPEGSPEKKKMQVQLDKALKNGATWCQMDSQAALKRIEEKIAKKKLKRLQEEDKTKQIKEQL